MYLMSRSIILDGDLDYDDDLARFGDPFRQARTKAGRKGIPHPIGPALVWAPFLAVAHGAATFLNLFGADIATHGYTMFHQRVVFATSVLFAVLSALLAWLVMRRWLEDTASSLCAIVAVLFGTAITYYVTYMPSYAHGADALVCSGLLAYWALTYGRWTRRRFILAGLLLGSCALVRITGFSLGIVFALEIAVETVRRVRARVPLRAVLVPAAYGALALLLAIVVFIPQMLAWKQMYGEYLTSPMGPRFMRMDEPRILETLFSSRNGWLSTHPIAYIGVIGLFFVPRRMRVIAIGFGLATAAQVYINSCVFDWWGGASFGQRRMCSVTLVLIVGVASVIAAGRRALQSSARWKRLSRGYWAVVAIVLGWFVVWNMVMVGRLRDSVPPSSSRRMCCQGLPAPMAAVAQPIYDWIGNPFALPGSAILAWKYDVPLKRWDEAVGHDADEPDLTLYNRGEHTRRSHKWNLPGDGFAPYLIGGFGPGQTDGQHHWRWTTAQRGRLLVPLMVPETHTFKLPVYPNVVPGASVRVRVGFDDEVVIDRELSSGWSDLEFTVPTPGVGMHELWIDASPRIHVGAPRPGLPKGIVFVGVAAGPITIGYPSEVSQ
jgi:hypothetical protein